MRTRWEGIQVFVISVPAAVFSREMEGIPGAMTAGWWCEMQSVGMERRRESIGAGMKGVTSRQLVGYCYVLGGVSPSGAVTPVTPVTQVHQTRDS
jgi:hypothetical protein